MNKKKKAVKIVMIALIVLSAVIVLIITTWVIISPGKIRTYDGEKSLSEKFVMNINGAPNGFFINSINTDNPVLLFVSSGPGTDDYVFTDKYEDMRLEEDFTVVYWDYRNMGIAYDKNYDPEQITLENIMNDTHDVTLYLKKRFSKKKIFIMGFSGGTHFALKAAEQYPEDYYALINMAQAVTDSSDRDTLMFNFMKDAFTSRRDEGSLKKLEASVVKQEGGKVRCINWYDYVYLLHYAGGGTIKDKSEFEGIVLPIIFCRCYTIAEKLNYITAMKQYRTTPLYRQLENFDYRTEITELHIPAYFISGEYDYNCPWELVREYESILNAPDKGFNLIPESAHSPLWEKPLKTCEILRQIKEKNSDE